MKAYLVHFRRVGQIARVKSGQIGHAVHVVSTLGFKFKLDGLFSIVRAVNRH